MRQRSAISTAAPSGDRADQRQQIMNPGRRQAAEQPERHRRQLVVGVGEIFHEADAGAEQRSDHDAGQYQHQDRIARAHRRADHVDDADRDQPADKGDGLDREHAEREIDAEHGAKRRARRCPQNIRRDQRVAKQSLKRRAGHRERRADQHRRHHARPAHLPYDAFDRRRYVAARTAQLRDEHADEITKRYRIAPDRQRQQQGLRSGPRSRSQIRAGRIGHCSCGEGYQSRPASTWSICADDGVT